MSSNPAPPAKWADAEKSALLRAELAAKLEDGMQVQELHRILCCSRTSAWRFMRGGRIRNSVLSRVLLALSVGRVLSPDLGVEGAAAAFKAWRMSTAPQDQRRVMHQLLGFIAELALVVFHHQDVVYSSLLLANGRPAGAKLLFTTPSGAKRMLQITIAPNFTLTLDLAENGRSVAAGLAATPEALGRMLKSKPTRKAHGKSRQA